MRRPKITTQLSFKRVWDENTLDTRRTYYDHEPAYKERRARGYSGWSMSDDDGSYTAFEAFLQSRFMPPSGKAVDFGCGGGDVATRLDQLGWTVAAVEYAATALAMARENAARGGGAPHLVRADLTQPLPFRSDAFDLAVDNHVLHCLIEKAHRRAFLDNAYRSLREGGIFFSANMSAEGHLDYERYGIDRSTRIIANKTRFWATADELRTEFEGAGFSIISFEFMSGPDDEGAGDEAVIYGQKE